MQRNPKRNDFIDTTLTVFRGILFIYKLVGISSSGGFRGGRAGSPLPPPLGDGLTPSLTVMLANAKF